MKVRDCHERWVAAAPDRITALIADFDMVWPAQLAPTPREVGPGRYDAGLMIWQEVERPGAARAFRVASPEEIRGEHWFELVPDGSGTVVRHTIEVTAAGRYEAIWAERIGPKHGVIMEALLDKVEALAS